MNLESIRENRAKTILQFSVPSIIAMVLTSLVTVADGFFIGNFVGPAGIAAVNLGLPVIYLYLAVGLMVSVGGIAIAGMALGGGNTQKAAGVFNQTMATVAAISALLSVLVYFCLEPVLHFLQAGAQVGGYFRDYYSVMLLQLPVMVINASFGMFIRGEGKPQFFMRVNILNVLLNILLNYVFVRWFGWGVKGIAAASLLAALAVLLCTLHFFVKKARVYRFGRFTFSGPVLRRTLFNGSSEFVGEISLAVAMFAYNFIILKNIGVDGVTAFTIVGYLSYVFSMVVTGFGQGASPLISFCCGAKQHALARGLRKITNGMVLFCGGVVFLLALLCAGWYSSLFVNSEAVESLVRSGVSVFAVSFLFSGVNTVTSFYFTSIGKAVESAVISSARGLVILLVCIFVFPPLWGMTGVWLVAPVTEALTLLLSALFIYRDSREPRAELPFGTAGVLEQHR